MPFEATATKKGTANHLYLPLFLTDETEFVLFLAMLENSVLGAGAVQTRR